MLAAWYHIVARIDTTASGGNRIRIYVNGVQETSLATSTEPDQNSTFSIGTTSDPIVVGGLYGTGYGIGSGIQVNILTAILLKYVFAKVNL